MPDLHAFDWAILAAYFAAVFTVGYCFGRREENSEDFVAAGRRMPWGAVLFSIIATEISAVTFLSVPGEGFANNLSYLQFGVGSLCARFFIAGFFLTAFYASRYLTIYSYLADRFGVRSRYTAAIYFLITRILASSVRLLIATYGLAVFFGIPLWISLLVFTVASLLYTSFGGLKAVIWTDLLQACVFVAGGVAVALFLQAEVGWGSILASGAETGRLELFRFRPDGGAGWIGWLSDPGIFYFAFFNGLVMTAAALGTDQDMMQRVLSCREVKRARWSMILSGFVGIPIAAGFLFIGVGLWVYFQEFPDPGLPGLVEHGRVAADQVFPYFISEVLPFGMRGLLLIGIFATAMSSLDSAVSALSSSVVIDLYRPLIRKHGNERHYLVVNRICVVGFGILLAVLAWSFRDAEGFLWLGFKLVSITYGSLLGVFLVGVLTRRGSDRGNVVGMIAGSMAAVVLLVGTEVLGWPIAWTWTIIVGALVTFGCGVIPAGDDGPHPGAG